MNTALLYYYYYTALLYYYTTLLSTYTLLLSTNNKYQCSLQYKSFGLIINFRLITFRLIINISVRLNEQMQKY